MASIAWTPLGRVLFPYPLFAISRALFAFWNLLRRCNKDHKNSTGRENPCETKSGFLRLLIGRGVVRACLPACSTAPFFLPWPRTSRRAPATQWTSPGDAPMTNTSFFTADQTTHLKIVVVSLLASIAVMVVGIAARPQVATDTQQANVYKPAKAIVATSTSLSDVR